MLFPTQKFNGSRLREGREARALTQIGLADLLGVAPSSVSQYESGDQTPSPAVMAKISSVLNLPTHFFTRTRQKKTRQMLFWRSQSAATKRARDAHEARYEWFRDVLGVIEESVEFPKPDLPDFKPPSDPNEIGDEQIEDYASQLRRHWGLGDGPISNLVWLIENKGGVVVRSELGDQKLDAYSDWDKGGSWRCYLFLGSDKKSAARSRFDAAHELGHSLIHRNVPERIRKTSEFHKLMEAQAHRFAGALMLPATTFPSEVFAPSLQSLLHLKPRWKMSVAAMISRLFDLEAITEDRRRQLFIQVSRNGWTKNEPLDNELEPEEPRLIKRSLDLLLDQNILSAEEIDRRTGLGPRDVERLLGLPTGYLNEPPESLILPLRIAH